MSLKMHVVIQQKYMSGFLGPESRFGHKRKVLDQQGYEAKPSF
jgi:hypothetical protein